jgi:hypothetical protein
MDHFVPCGAFHWILSLTCLFPCRLGVCCGVGLHQVLLDKATQPPVPGETVTRVPLTRYGISGTMGDTALAIPEGVPAS